jgi:hypothetical protein
MAMMHGIFLTRYGVTGFGLRCLFCELADDAARWRKHRFLKLKTHYPNVMEAARNFLTAYTENEIFKKNPFASLDQTGVSQLVQTAIKKGRSTRPDIKLRI